jgi:hypothetical protein
VGRILTVLLPALALLATACTAYHSRQALFDPTAPTPPDDATFVSEEDSGLAILGVLVVSEPDHYAVLLERARRRHECRRLHHVQLDYYTDHWLLVGFPIARITALCEPVTRTGTETGAAR